jgi:hypothetical protein
VGKRGEQQQSSLHDSYSILMLAGSFQPAQGISPLPLVWLPRTQPSVLIMQLTVDICPRNSCHCPSPLLPQQSRLPNLSLRGNQNLIYQSDYQLRMPIIKLPEQQQTDELLLLPGWFLLLLWYNLVSFHIIIFDSCHKPEITAIWCQYKSHSLS